MASGMIVDFTIDPDLVGIAIGKKGVRIKQVEKDSGVSSVNVDGKTGTAYQFVASTALSIFNVSCHSYPIAKSYYLCVDMLISLRMMII